MLCSSPWLLVQHWNTAWAGVSRAARSGEESRESWVPKPPCTAGCHQTNRVPLHSQEWLLHHCQWQGLSEKIKKNQTGSLWPMELIQGLLCGKTHPTPQERPGRQSGTDYSLGRDFIAGSIKMNFLNTCFLLALSSSANPGSHTVRYNASKWRRKQQGTLKIVILILRLCF